MGKEEYDIVVEIKFGIAHNGDYAIKSNTTKKGLLSILENAICSQIGTGADRRPPNEGLEWYTIRVGHRMDDTFNVVHDCGNDRLALGIMVHVMERECGRTYAGFAPLAG
jgi:hypothetical protein